MDHLELIRILQQTCSKDAPIPIRIIDRDKLGEVDIGLFYNTIDKTILIAQEHLLEATMSKLFTKLEELPSGK